MHLLFCSQRPLHPSAIPAAASAAMSSPYPHLLHSLGLDLTCASCQTLWYVELHSIMCYPVSLIICPNSDSDSAMVSLFFAWWNTLPVKYFIKEMYFFRVWIFLCCLIMGRIRPENEPCMRRRECWGTQDFTSGLWGNVSYLPKTHSLFYALVWGKNNTSKTLGLIWANLNTDRTDILRTSCAT